MRGVVVINYMFRRVRINLFGISRRICSLFAVIAEKVQIRIRKMFRVGDLAQKTFGDAAFAVAVNAHDEGLPGHDFVAE